RPPLCIFPMPKTIREPIPAPIKQASMMPKKLRLVKKAMATARAALAPAVSPSSPGSPSGLRLMPWMMAPDTARAAPTRAAATSRGKRISRRMLIFALVSEEVSASHTSRREMSAAPKAMEPKKAKANSRKKSAIWIGKARTGRCISVQAPTVNFTTEKVHPEDASFSEEFFLEEFQLVVQRVRVVELEGFGVCDKGAPLFYSGQVFIGLRFHVGVVGVVKFADDQVIARKLGEHFRRDGIIARLQGLLLHLFRHLQSHRLVQDLGAAAPVVPVNINLFFKAFDDRDG